MAYVERGVVKDKRSKWSFSYFVDLFWSIVYFFVNFFKTMFSMDATESYKKRSGSGGGWGGGPGGGGPSGGGPRRPPRGLDNVKGIDHSSLPACGSCCGG